MGNPFFSRADTLSYKYAAPSELKTLDSSGGSRVVAGGAGAACAVGLQDSHAVVGRQHLCAFDHDLIVRRELLG